MARKKVWQFENAEVTLYTSCRKMAGLLLAAAKKIRKARRERLEDEKLVSRLEKRRGSRFMLPKLPQPSLDSAAPFQQEERRPAILVLPAPPDSRLPSPFSFDKADQLKLVEDLQPSDDVPSWRLVLLLANVCEHLVITLREEVIVGLMLFCSIRALKGEKVPTALEVLEIDVAAGFSRPRRDTDQREELRQKWSKRLPRTIVAELAADEVFDDGLLNRRLARLRLGGPFPSEK